MRHNDRCCAVLPALAATLLGLGVVAPLPAQTRTLSTPESYLGVLAAPMRLQAPPGSPGASIGGGITLGITGWALGAVVGNKVANCKTDDGPCQLNAFLGGRRAGGTLGMALGVHLGNSRRGSFLKDCFVGALVWGVGMGIVVASRNQAAFGVALLAVPAAQLAAMVAVERKAGTARAAGGTSFATRSLQVGPVWTGKGPGVVASLAF